MASQQKHILFDRELELAIEQFRAENSLSFAGAVRYLLRESLKITRSPRDAVWREVRSEVGAVYRAALERALSEIPQSEPGNHPVNTRKT